MALFKEVKPGRHRPRTVRNGLIFLGLFALILFIAYSGGKIPGVPKGGYTVKAMFATAANVQPGKTPVRVKGINVGEVEKVQRGPGGQGAVITMRIKDKGVHLRKDARADIYWRTLLGFAFYVQLDPGSDPQKLGGAEIPESRTSTQVELDQVLTALNKPSRAGIQTLFREFDKGFRGNSAGDAIDTLGPAMKQVAPGIAALRGENPGDLTKTVHNAANLTGVLARSEAQLGGLVDTANTTLGVTAARRAALNTTFQQGPATLDQTRSTMARLRTTLAKLNPIADELQPGARKLDDTSTALRPALRKLQPVLDDARPLLSDLRPALRHLRSASNAGVPVLQQLDPALDRLNGDIIPKLNTPGVKGTSGLKMYEAVGPVVSAVTSSSSQWDANGYIQRFHAFASGERAISGFPCQTDLFHGKVSCSDFKQIVQLFTGQVPSGEQPPAAGGADARSGKAAKAGAPGVLTIAAPKTQAPSNDADVVNEPAAPPVLTQATGIIKHLLKAGK